MKKLPPNAGKGRKRGVPNKTTSTLKAAILAALDEAGGSTYLVKQANDNPAQFLALLGKVLPLDVPAPSKATAHAQSWSVETSSEVLARIALDAMARPAERVQAVKELNRMHGFDGDSELVELDDPDPDV
ncbi:MAG: hypothetical protein V4563_15465 [Pseudomonadota bacterium]